MGEPSVLSLPAMLDRIPDPRKARGRRHPWAALLLLIVVALLSGADSQRAIARWGRDADRRVRRRLGLARRRGPSLATLHRALRRVPIAALEACLGEWLARVRAAWRRGGRRWLDGVAIDGKTLRGARRLGAHELRRNGAHLPLDARARA